MIKTWADISKLAKERGPKRLAVLAPEDGEFMLAVKKCWQNGYIEPVLIGNREKMAHIADEVHFDIGSFETIPEDNLQAIADLGTRMLFAGDIDIESKGQIPTSYIYRAIIREEAKTGTKKALSVITPWEVPGLNRLIAFTDGGVNINPDYRAKIDIIKHAVFTFHLFGYPKPKIAVLSGQRGIGGSLASYDDAIALRNAAASGELGECDVIEATSFSEIFLEKKKRIASHDDIDMTQLPDIFIVPNIDTGNIFAKLDSLVGVTRWSLIVSSRGPVTIPSRSDFCDDIMREIAMGVVIADRIKEGGESR